MASTALKRLRRAALRLRRPQRPSSAAKVAAKPAPDDRSSRETLLHQLERGRRLDRAILAQVRALITAGDPDTARAVAESLRQDEDWAPVGHVAAGIVAFRAGYLELALAEFRQAPPRTRFALAATAYVRAGLAIDPTATLEELRALVADTPDQLSAKVWFEVLKPVFGFGDQQLAREVLAVIERRVRDDSQAWDAQRQLEWMRPWIAADGDSPTAPTPPSGRRTFAIVDYGHPGADRASANIGDHIQTIAALGHLVRHQEVRLHGEPELVGLLEGLRQRTRPERRLDDHRADLEVMTVHRDASMYEAIPEDSWVLCFGWYMHALFSMRHGFPLHGNLRPIFISFHCNKRRLLTPDAIAYLKRYGPVGCRDWTTVYLLLSMGVPAFFSGCLTTTIDTLFPDLEAAPPASAPIAYVDVPDAPAGAVTYRHSNAAVRRRRFVPNVGVALDRLDTYRTKHSKVVTSRLHCYLPVRSIGVPVDFRPHNRSDIRFDGLLDIDEAAFDAIRQGISAKLEQVLGAILSGRPEADVYALWRSLTAGEVAAAEQRRGREERLPPGPRAAVPEPLTDVAPAPDDAIHCAVMMPADADWPEVSLGVLISSLLEHASRPIHLAVLGARGTRAREQRLTERFPEVTFSWTPPPLEHVRLRLADLLPDAARAILLPLPAVIGADVAELADLDLGPHAIGAATRPDAESGFGLIHTAALRLGPRADVAAELRRTAYARHRFDFDAFATDVLVLDLERLRREDFGGTAMALVHAYGLDELEVLHYLIGPNRAEIPARWSVVPTRTPERGPGLTHWADGVKPWQPVLTPERERWREYAGRYREGAAQATAP